MARLGSSTKYELILMYRHFNKCKLTKTCLTLNNWSLSGMTTPGPAQGPYIISLDEFYTASSEAMTFTDCLKHTYHYLFRVKVWTIQWKSYCKYVHWHSGGDVKTSENTHRVLLRCICWIIIQYSQQHTITSLNIFTYALLSPEALFFISECKSVCFIAFNTVKQFFFLSHLEIISSSTPYQTISLTQSDTKRAQDMSGISSKSDCTHSTPVCTQLLWLLPFYSEWMLALNLAKQHHTATCILY